MKRGLVLEGGAMRGMFTMGILDVLMENGVTFDGAVGVSAGACFGINYKSHQIGRALRYNLRYCRDPRYCGVRSLLRTGDIFGVDFCYRAIPETLDPFDYETFVRNPMEFHVVCTDADTGAPLYRRLHDARNPDMYYLQASASMPMVSHIVEVDGLRLIDGGVSDSIPLRYFESLGYDRNVVILTRPDDYVKKPPELLPLMRVLLRKTPALVRAMEHRHEVYNAQTAYVRARAQQGAVLRICPDAPLDIGHTSHDPVEISRVYQIGRRAGETNLDRIREFLME